MPWKHAPKGRRPRLRVLQPRLAGFRLNLMAQMAQAQPARRGVGDAEANL